MPTHGEMINRVSKQFSGTFSSEELVDEIIKQYGNSRSIDKNSLMTDVAGCCVNLKSHKHLLDLPLCLVQVSRGLYHRYDPKKDRHLNLHI